MHNREVKSNAREKPELSGCGARNSPAVQGLGDKEEHGAYKLPYRANKKQTRGDLSRKGTEKHDSTESGTIPEAQTHRDWGNVAARTIEKGHD
jgi:hypothetical protein